MPSIGSAHPCAASCDTALVGLAKFRQVFPEEFAAVERLVRRACETDSPPACRFRSDSRRRRRHRLRRRRCAASPATAQRWRSGRDIAPRARTPATSAACSMRSRSERIRSVGSCLQETASRRAPLPDRSPAWSSPPRRDPGSARCRTAGTAADDSGSDRLCTTEPGSAVDQVDDPVGQVGREVGAVVELPSFRSRRVT